MERDVQKINIKELTSAVSQICDEKGIERQRVMGIVEDALAAAYKKDYGRKGQVIRAKFDPKAQTASFVQVKEVVDETVRIMEEERDEEEEGATEERPETAPAEATGGRDDENAAEGEEDEDKLPRFNQERDILVADAQKHKKGAEVGDEIEIQLEAQNQFGRVAAQNAKQVIIQKLREAERETLYEEFKNKEGEVISATVQRVENRNVYLDLGKMVGMLFPADQVQGENYRAGQRIKVYVAKVDKDAKDTTVTLSRSNPQLVAKLFSLEVPEIFSGTVTIESIAREPGSRSKIAVKSGEEGIDPIGSCVGQKGIRVQAVIDELGGEKIDIIEFNEDPKVFISHALAPAKVKYVEIDEEDKRATVTVEPDQLSLAIGKRGQNVRLAAKLTGWKIDVTGTEETDAEAKPAAEEGAEGEAAAKPAAAPAEEKAEKGTETEEVKETEVKEEKQEEPTAEKEVLKEKPATETKKAKAKKEETKK